MEGINVFLVHDVVLQLECAMTQLVLEEAVIDLLFLLAWVVLSLLTAEGQPC